MNNCLLMTMCCIVQGQGQSENRVPEHLHNDVTENAQGPSNDVTNTPCCTVNSDTVANSNGRLCYNNSPYFITSANQNVVVLDIVLGRLLFKCNLLQLHVTGPKK